jgi:hypothetical protein
MAQRSRHSDDPVCGALFRGQIDNGSDEDHLNTQVDDSRLVELSV